ncbi:methyltransferase [Streptomyces triticirhizae]|uniref:Methyltransferase n=1 Tax=Streptomyces triticirhizae TaxID=2483353 RepID=A0A3M2LG03_9ACTN|nr:methyltransferase [Streptomyces triticirhizae]RMI36412.1 methyltransferase [Streptomyces triticirhizae]
MTNPALEAVTQLRRLALAAGHAAALRAAAQLGVADALGDEGATPAELARSVNADPDALERLLRALASQGVFATREDGGYAHTHVSRLLRTDTPRSLRDMVLWATEPWTWSVWPGLAEAVRNGKGGFAEKHGKDFFTFLYEDAPESAEVFNRAMTQASRLSSAAIADALALKGDQTVVDVAGGHGDLLTKILEGDPTVRGALFDLPGALPDCDARLRPGGEFADRVQLVAGDCRESVGVEGDVFILKNVLEWDDASTVAALRNVAAATRPGGRVVVIENLVDGSPETGFTTAMDLLLLLNVDGRKHLRESLLGLMAEAGLTVTDVRPVGPYLHLIDSRANASA